MNESCDNCYWKFCGHIKWCAYENFKPNENKCVNYNATCDECNGEQTEYKYNGKYYCWDCLMKKFKVEEHTMVSYYKGGEYLGNEDDWDEVIRNLNEDIEIL